MDSDKWNSIKISDFGFIMAVYDNFQQQYCTHVYIFFYSGDPNYIGTFPHACLAQLDQHQPGKPVMVSVVSSSPTGVNFIF